MTIESYNTRLIILQEVRFYHMSMRGTWGTCICSCFKKKA